MSALLSPFMPLPSLVLTQAQMKNQATLSLRVQTGRPLSRTQGLGKQPIGLPPAAARAGRCLGSVIYPLLGLELLNANWLSEQTG